MKTERKDKVNLSKSPMKLLDAIGELPEEMVAEAADQEKIRQICKKNKRRFVLRLGEGLAAAAIIGIVVWGAWVKPGISNEGEIKDGTESGIAKDFYSTEDSFDGSDFQEAEENQSMEESESKLAASGKYEMMDQFGISFLSSNTQNQLVFNDTSSGGNGNLGVPESYGDDTPDSSQDNSQKEDNTADEYSGQGTDSLSSQADENNNGWEDWTIALQAESFDKGKNEVLQYVMTLVGDGRKYNLTASEGISFLTAASLDMETGKTNKTENLNNVRKYECTSATKIGFSISLPAKQDGGGEVEVPTEIQSLWSDPKIKPVGYIQVQMEEKNGEEKEVTIFIGKRKKTYYAVFSE